MLEKLEKLKEEVLTNIDNIANLDDLNEIKVKILGKKGEFRVYGVKVTSKEQFKELTKMAQERMKKE